MAAALTLNLSINGSKPQPVWVVDGTEPLLYVLRNQLGLHGPKFGCGVAQCGSCTVHVNGAIVRSCVTPMNTLTDGSEITTLEGLTGPDQRPSAGQGQGGATGASWQSSKDLGSALQQSFVEQQAAQCGYCANAVIMGAAGWLQGRIMAGNLSVPSEDEVKQFLSGVGQTPSYVYLCRCGTHLRIIRAIRQAAARVLA